MLRLVNGLLGAACFVILASDVLAATHQLELKHAFGAMPNDRVGLREAISIAESRANGRAVDATLVRFAGEDSWSVDVATHGTHVHVSVDARTGAVDGVVAQSNGAR